MRGEVTAIMDAERGLQEIITFLDLRTIPESNPDVSIIKAKDMITKHPEKS